MPKTFEEDNVYDPAKVYQRPTVGKLMSEYDGLPFHLVIAFMEDGRIHRFPSVRFTSLATASEAARALISVGFCTKVWIEQEVAAFRVENVHAKS